MAEITEEEFKKHLDNLINALYALSPSRNYVLQFLNILPRDYPKMMEAYPDLFKDEAVRDRLKEILGIRISESVEVGGDVGYRLNEISKKVIDNFFGSYDWEEYHKKISEYLGRELPNVVEELWDHRIQMAILEPSYGDDSKRILTTMLKIGEGDKYLLSLAKLMEETGIDRSRLLKIKNFLTREIGILEPAEEVFSFAYALSQEEELLNRHFGE